MINAFKVGFIIHVILREKERGRVHTLTAGNVSPEASDDDDEGGGDSGSDLMIRPGGGKGG